MNDTFCTKCGKAFRNHSHDHQDNFEHHHERKHDDFNHFDRDDFICDRFICDDKFKVRLGGLTGGLNFRLRQLIGCKVKLNVECGGGCEKILAELCHVGNNYVEVKIIKKFDDPLADLEQAEEMEELEEELEVLREEMKALEDELAELEEPENEEEEDEEEPVKYRKKVIKKHKKRKKHHKKKVAIFPLESIKWFELKDDCDCDCR